MLAAILVIGLAAGVHAQESYTPWAEPVNLGPSLNTDVSEFFACVSKDGLSLYFTSSGGPNRPSLGGFDIYVSRRPSIRAEWGPAENLGEPINSPYDDVSPMLTTDGHWMYFASNRPGGFGGADIYVSRRHNKRDDFGWRPARNLGEGVNTEYNDAAPFIIEDERTGNTTLYFDSNRPEGPGPYTDDPVHNGNDIYSSTLRRDGTFNPAALVEELSTVYADRKPVVRRDGLEMFFTSNRPGGIGVIDLWVSTRESTCDPWSEPVNMGQTINRPGTQSGGTLSFDGRTLYFNAAKDSRPDGFGKFDLYVTTRERNRHGGYHRDWRPDRGRNCGRDRDDDRAHQGTHR
jgi:hypothetical protein